VALPRSGDDVGALAVVRGESRKYDFEAMELIDKLVAINESGSAQAAQLADQTYLHTRHLIRLHGGGAGAWPVDGQPGGATDLDAGACGGSACTAWRKASWWSTRTSRARMKRRAAARHEQDERQPAAHRDAGAQRHRHHRHRIGADLGRHRRPAQRTEGQAATLEETAATVEQLTTTVANNADKAQQAHKLMDQTAAVAREAEVAVSTVTATMDRISTSSRKIGDIVGLMDSIAFQTNLPWP
jgi:methyl-accepting chemotaxis protein